MKKLILIRFGTSPNPAVSQALKPHIKGPAFAGPIPGAIMSVFNSDSDEAQITQDLKETGALFFLLDSGNTHLNLPEGMMEAIDAVLEIPAETLAQVLTIDEILEKISAKGIGSLTPAERTRLEAGE